MQRVKNSGTEGFLAGVLSWVGIVGVPYCAENAVGCPIS